MAKTRRKPSPLSRSQEAFGTSTKMLDRRAFRDGEVKVPAKRKK